MNRITSILYIYNQNNLKELKESMGEYHFVSISYFLYLADNIEGVRDLHSQYLNNLVIDITGIIKDGNYYRIFTERYLWALSEMNSNIHFCLHRDYLNCFNEVFPHLFEEENINIFIQTSVNEVEVKEIINGKELNEEREICSSISLYTYKNSATAKELTQRGMLISLSNLVEEFEGIRIKYDMEQIANRLLKNEIEYVDISSLVKILKVRKDLVFVFEVLIYHITKIKPLKFTLEYSLISDTLELFPLIFADSVELDNIGCESEVTVPDIEGIDIKQVHALVDEINATLKGHDIFKEDFRHNLVKFSFLNKMKERKILSILLCGDSGIGKTEFAKIVSGIIYPEEALVKINFGNYSTEGVLNSLIGSPLGYIGSEESGELINKISSSKSKVILIDEFERATPSVYNFFYELLEDGIFTDRHGIEHNLNGYIIIFTSNMSQEQYQKHIPNSLKSRFDMVYYFTDLPIEEKMQFIQITSEGLVKKLQDKFEINVALENVKQELNILVKYRNLRDIKRKIEDIVFSELFKNYQE
ncbi:AAA family ATPase [Niameybacter massiliensis]|uniref:AAA family ATPase n=1 Tax=Holtiella tumoricola TaxID=3018743 RepID=A0AA42DMK8_9FIRM|nr:AAA family ATPase [Holtiella tumoricola]MDA3731458.1 AAA family ATPase [Holtiella tumoricola]